MIEKWDLIFVDWIDADGRIYLEYPQKFGYMTVSKDNIPTGIIKNSMGECGTKEDTNDDRQIFEATAIAIAYNHNNMIGSGGLVVRFGRGTRGLAHRHYGVSGEKDVWLGGKRKKDTTEWLIYISPHLELYRINEDRTRGQILDDKIQEKIKNCAKLKIEALERFKNETIRNSKQIFLKALEENSDVITNFLNDIDKYERIFVKIVDIDSALLSKHELASMSFNPMFWRIGLQAALLTHGISSIVRMNEVRGILLELRRLEELKPLSPAMLVCIRASIHEGMTVDYIEETVRKIKQSLDEPPLFPNLSACIKANIYEGMTSDEIAETAIKCVQYSEE